VHWKALLPKIKNTRTNSAQGARMQTKRVEFHAAKASSPTILTQKQTNPLAETDGEENHSNSITMICRIKIDLHSTPITQKD